MIIKQRNNNSSQRMNLFKAFIKKSTVVTEPARKTDVSGELISKIKKKGVSKVGKSRNHKKADNVLMKIKKSPCCVTIRSLTPNLSKKDTIPMDFIKELSPGLQKELRNLEKVFPASFLFAEQVLFIFKYLCLIFEKHKKNIKNYDIKTLLSCFSSKRAKTMLQEYENKGKVPFKAIIAYLSKSLQKNKKIQEQSQKTKQTNTKQNSLKNKTKVKGNSSYRSHKQKSQKPNKSINKNYIFNIKTESNKNYFYFNKKNENNKTEDSFDFKENRDNNRLKTLGQLFKRKGINLKNTKDKLEKNNQTVKNKGMVMLTDFLRNNRKSLSASNSLEEFTFRKISISKNRRETSKDDSLAHGLISERLKVVKEQNHCKFDKLIKQPRKKQNSLQKPNNESPLIGRKIELFDSKMDIFSHKEQNFLQLNQKHEYSTKDLKSEFYFD